ncbi:MAG TPA: hypothetical protein VGE07_11605 [Herpetosiphonaceae bacterium]
MRQTLMKWGAATMIAAGLLFGGAMINETFAQTPQPSTTDPAKANPVRLQPSSRQQRPGLMGRGKNQRQPGALLKAALVKQTIELTGMERKAVVDQLRGGSSLSAIAAANGSSEQAVIDAALKQLDERLGQAVAKGRFTDTEKTTALAEARAAAPGLMQETGLNLPGKNQRQQAGRHQLIKATAEVTGLTEEQVRAEVQAGKSLAQIAESKGKTVDDVLANLKAKADAKVDQLLEKAREQINKVPGK